MFRIGDKVISLGIYGAIYPIKWPKRANKNLVPPNTRGVIVGKREITSAFPYIVKFVGCSTPWDVKSTEIEHNEQ